MNWASDCWIEQNKTGFFCHYFICLTCKTWNSSNLSLWAWRELDAKQPAWLLLTFKGALDPFCHHQQLAEEQLRAAAASPWSDDVLHQHCSVSQTPQKLHTHTKKGGRKNGEHANLSKIKTVTVLVTCSFSSTAPMFDQRHLFSPEDQLTQLYYLGLSVWCKYSLQLTAERAAA